MALWQFRYNVSHIPGAKNSAADALSHNRAHLLPQFVPTANALPSHVSSPLQELMFNTSASWTSGSLERVVQTLYGDGIAGNSARTYKSTSCHYLTFWHQANLTPIPLSEHTHPLHIYSASLPTKSSTFIYPHIPLSPLDISRSQLVYQTFSPPTLSPDCHTSIRVL